MKSASHESPWGWAGIWISRALHGEPAVIAAQREFFSERAIGEAERALVQALASLDQLCCRQDAECAVSELLRKFDVLARLAAWSDPRQVH